MNKVGIKTVMRKNHDSNYLAKVVELSNVRKHPNADRLQIANVDLQTVIVGLDAKDGDRCVFFPEGSKINEDFISYINGFRESDKNVDKEESGFFEHNCRVRAVKLRGEYSYGFVIPTSKVEGWGKLPDGFFDDKIDYSFDYVNGQLFVEKYIAKRPNKTGRSSGVSPSQKAIDDRLVPGQVNLHCKTPNMRSGAYIFPNSDIDITYKIHGTSFWVGNLLIKRKKTLKDRIASLFSKVEDVEYEIMYGSRRLIRNNFLGAKHPGYYMYDLWRDIASEIGDLIPKGYTVYGEYAGYTKTGMYVQRGYDYGCIEGEGKMFVYRITHTTPDGFVTELSSKEIREFCDRNGLKHVPSLWSGLAGDLLHYEPGRDIDEWRRELVSLLEKKFVDGRCYLCRNDVPKEGIVLRQDSLYAFEALKLKGFEFLRMEGVVAESGGSNMEDEN